MVDEYLSQFEHLQRTFLAVLRDFDEEQWKNAGSGITTPALTAYHIAQSIHFYTEDPKPLTDRSNRVRATPRHELSPDELPSKDDVEIMIEQCGRRIEEWLGSMDFEAENTTFPWTGKTNHSVVLFLLRHSQYHLGELDALLNETLDGKAADHFANTV